MNATPPTERRWSGPAVAGTLLWVVLVCVAAAIVAHARFTADLSAFLPETPTATQRLLVSQLREGIASRLIIVAIEGGESATRARVSGGMAERLRKDPRFASVSNGDDSGQERDRAFLFDHRYVLSEWSLRITSRLPGCVRRFKTRWTCSPLRLGCL